GLPQIVQPIEEGPTIEDVCVNKNSLGHNRRLAGVGLPTPASQYCLSVGEEPFALLIQAAQLFEGRTASSRISLAQVQHFIPVETRMRPLLVGADSAFGHPLHQSRPRNAEQ